MDIRKIFLSVVALIVIFILFYSLVIHNKRYSKYEGVFVNKLDENNWVEIGSKISDIIDADLQDVYVQNMDIEWDNMELLAVSLKVSFNNTLYQIVFENHDVAKEKPQIDVYQYKHDNSNSQDLSCSMDYLFQLLNTHGLTPLTTNMKDSPYHLKLFMTKGSIEYKSSNKETTYLLNLYDMTLLEKKIGFYEKTVALIVTNDEDIMNYYILDKLSK